MLCVGNLEKRLARGDELAALHVLLQYGSRQWRLHLSVGYLVGNLLALRFDAVYLSANTFALFRQTGIVAANLVAGGITLAFKNLDLVVDVIELLTWYGTVLNQFAETLTFALGIGDLLIDGRKLLLQVEPTAVGGISRRTQLSLLGFQLTCSHLQLIGIDLTDHLPTLYRLPLDNIEGLQLTSRFGRHGHFCCLKRARGIKLFLFVSASGHHQGHTRNYHCLFHIVPCIMAFLVKYPNCLS